MYFWKPFLIGVCFVFEISNLLAQEDSQFRLLLHPTVDLTNAWFIPGWIIATAASASPDNVNLLAGAGYRGESWSLEGLAQRHWNTMNKHWFLNFRFRKEFGAEGADRGRMVLYLEPTVVLSQRGFAESGFWEYRVLDSPDSRLRGSFSFGAETENIQRVGKDAKNSWGAGPRASFAFGPKTGRVVIALTYQFRWEEKDLWRVYLVINRRSQKFP